MNGTENGLGIVPRLSHSTTDPSSTDFTGIKIVCSNSHLVRLGPFYLLPDLLSVEKGKRGRGSESGSDTLILILSILTITKGNPER